MFSFKNVDYYVPENFTINDYKIYKINKSKIHKNQKSLEEETITRANQIRKALEEVIHSHTPDLNNNLIEIVKYYYNELENISSLTFSDLIDLFKKSLITLKNINNLFLHNSDYFYKQGVTQKNIVSYSMKLLHARSSINNALNFLTKAVATLKTSIVLFKASKPKSICASKVRTAFIKAIQMLNDETKMLVSEDGIFVQTITLQFLNYYGPHFNELIKAYRTIIKIKTHSESELPLKHLHEICEAHLYNINLLNADTFGKTSLAEVKATAKNLKTNPEKIYLFYLPDFKPAVINEEQEDIRSNLLSAFQKLSTILQEKYSVGLDLLLKENFKCYREAYLKQTTVGEIIQFFARFKKAYLAYSKIGKLTDEYVQEFNCLQKKYDEISKIFFAQTIARETSIQLVETTLKLLNGPLIDNLSADKKQKVMNVHEELKNAAMVDIILWDAISSCNLTSISTKLAKDLLILHEYCLKNTVIDDNENLIIIRIKKENEPITKFYQELLIIRLSDAPIHIQAKLITAKEKEFKEDYNPAVMNFVSICNLLFNNPISYKNKSPFNPQFTVFWMKNKNFHDQEKQDVSLFKRPGY